MYELPIVMDNGSYSLKYGFGGEDQPRSVIPTIIGRKKLESSSSVLETSQRDIIGEEALVLKSILDIKRPLERGVITDRYDMEKIWNFAFYSDLRITPQEHAIFLSEPPLNHIVDRERIAEIMFEVFNVPALYLASQADMALVASGRTTGCIVDIGFQKGHIVPFFEGITIKEAIQKFDYGGRHITEYLRELLKLKGFSFESFTEIEVLKDIKQQLCYIAPNFEREMTKSKTQFTKDFTIPDGQIISLDSERFHAPEILFKPILSGNYEKSLDELIVDAISKCEVDLRREFYNNIILTGASTLLPGLEPRLTMEVQKRIPSSVNVNIIAPPEREYSVWIGGSIFSSLSRFQKLWITPAEYNEKGSAVLDRCGSAIHNII